MLGNCIIRNPSTRDGSFDKGTLCETLLFFGKTHLLIDIPTLGSLVQANFLDDLIAMLRAGFLTANYSPQAGVLYSENKSGLREHFFTVIKISGDQKQPNMRNPELLESQLERLCADKGIARKYFRQLGDLLSFKDLEVSNVAELGRKDVCDPYIAKEVARMALRAKGIPDEEIKFTKVEVFPLDGNKFAISTDIDFDKLRRFVPEGDRAAFGQNYLFPAISDARFDMVSPPARTRPLLEMRTIKLLPT